MSFKTILVAGASRGIGLAVAEHLVSQSNRLLAVSRTAAPIGEWIQADLSNLAGVKTVTKATGDDCLDALLYMGGTWETHAFTQCTGGLPHQYFIILNKNQKIYKY